MTSPPSPAPPGGAAYNPRMRRPLARLALALILGAAGGAPMTATAAPALLRHAAPELRVVAGRFESAPVEVPGGFTELVPSWNATVPAGGALTLEVRADVGGRWTKYYSFGRWSREDRASVVGQKDADGNVLTDTLRLTKPARRYQYRLNVSGDGASVRLVTFAATNGAPAAPPVSNRAAWGRVLDVPRRSQRLYAGGDDWCSPTSVSMVLAFWGVKVGVLDAVKGTYDRVYEGTGNWAFNAAYAGSFGLTAYVTRLRGLADVERFVAAGVPVVLSVAWKAGELPNASLSSTNGHLLVAVGFDANGNVVVNDPYADADALVRRTYDRAIFERLWLRASGGTAYVIHPEGRGPNL